MASRPPRLLQDLESQLVDRLRANDKTVSTALLVTKDRDPGMSANLSLDAHRHVLAAFTQGFTTYTGLLSAVQVSMHGRACVLPHIFHMLQVCPNLQTHRHGAGAAPMAFII